MDAAFFKPTNTGPASGTTSSGAVLCEHSASGAKWQLAPADERAITTLSQKLNLPDIVARLLVQRGVSLEHAEGFLNPKLKHSLPDPSQFQDMHTGAQRLAAAIISRETIAIFGDYDVDGATSSALLCRYLRQLGCAPLIHIPDRITEGYGPNIPAFESLKAKGASLIITVDCGTLAFEPLTHAYQQGLDVMVVDHHQAQSRLPDAVAVINPNRLDESGQCRQLAAVGVCFLLLVAIQRILEEDGFFTTRPKPDLLDLLDLVAIGTICDVVPLTELNRSFVSQGLRRLCTTSNEGIQALKSIAGVSGITQASHIGFALGPRINAGGRVGRASAGVELLTCDDPIRAGELAKELDGYNAERRAIESHMAEQALAQAQQEIASMPQPPGVVVVANAHWHQGIIGIVASRLKEHFNRPAIVISLEEGTLGKGSARSIPGFDMGAAIISAVDCGLLMKGGGHAMAAGFSIHPANIPEFQRYMHTRFEQSPIENVAMQHEVHAVLRASGVTLDMVEKLSTLAPYGAGNPEPCIALQQVRLLKSSVVGSGHVKTLWVDAAIRHAALSAISFRAEETAMGQALLRYPSHVWDILVTLEIDHWQGQKRVNMVVKDAVKHAPV